MEAARSDAPDPDRVTIRKAVEDDAAAIAALSTELGYPVPVAEIRHRVERLAPLEDHVIYVASSRSQVVAWIHILLVQHLQDKLRAEIGGLVVSSRHRNAGVGRLLVLEAERWAAERGIKQILVRSQIAREAAHRFYLREGYSRIKTSAVFTKWLS